MYKTPKKKKKNKTKHNSKSKFEYNDRFVCSVEIRLHIQRTLLTFTAYNSATLFRLFHGSYTDADANSDDSQPNSFAANQRGAKKKESVIGKSLE